MSAGMFGWYRGWTMVALGIIMTTISTGTIIYGYSVYLTPASEELGLSRETANAGIVFQHIGAAFLAPIIGRTLDFVKVRTVVLACGLALGAGVIGMGVGDALWPRAGIMAVAFSMGLAGAGAISSYVLVSRWFKVNRGRAMTIVAFGQSGGSIFVAPAVAMLIEGFGWREALLIHGLFIMVATVLIVIGMKDRPDADEHEPVGKTKPRVTAADVRQKAAGGKPLSLKEIASSPIFWVLAIIVASTLAIVQASLASLVPLARGRDIPLVQATTLLTMLGLSGIFGKVALAFVADRFQRITLLSLSIFMIMCFTLSLTIDAGFGGLVAGVLFVGMAIGGFFPMYSALLADLFGSDSLGTTEGLVAPCIASASAVAIWAAGYTFDLGGNYRLTFFIFSGVLLAMVLLALAVRIFGKTHTVEPDPA